MKNGLYILFLLLMSVTYTRVSENYAEISVRPEKKFSRGPASIDIYVPEPCEDLPLRFNPHSASRVCE